MSALPNDLLPDMLPDDVPWALFLDLDGTLCGFKDDPARVALDELQCEVIESLHQRLDGALCVLSGRESADLDRALGRLDIPRVGEHGRNRNEVLPDEIRKQIESAYQGLLRVAMGRAGVWVERKPESCALHYRTVPDLAEILTQAVRRLAEPLSHLRLMEGQCVFEFTSNRTSKGHALRVLMQEEPFAGRIPVAAGDDVTDEDAFVAATALGGFGIAVGPRVSRAARYRVSSPNCFNAWLHKLVTTPGAAAHA